MKVRVSTGLLLLAAFGATAKTATLIGHGVTQQTRYIIKFRDIASTADNPLLAPQQSLEQHIQAIGGTVLHRLPSVSSVAAMLSSDQVAALKANRQVERIEKDPVRELAHKGRFTYGVSMIQAPEVSDADTGNQTVCIIDTGYDANHEDLPSGVNVTGAVVNTLTTAYDIGDWFEDSYGHGTHVFGTIAALGNNLGYEGILPSNLAKYHHVKVVHHKGYWRFWGSDLIAGLAECRNAGATVVNMSLAGTNTSEAEREAMNQAYADGVLLVAAGGNFGSDEKFYPASYDSVIAVGAIDEAFNAWQFTQRNEQIELVAPGVNVVSTLPNNQYRGWDGSSVATPHVTGVAALVWSQFPTCSNTKIREALRQSALDLGESGKDDTYGYGVVQAKAAVDWLTTNGCGLPKSCKEILDSGLSIGDGVYRVDFDGDGATPEMDVQCDMTRDGGGWTGITPEVAFNVAGRSLSYYKSHPGTFRFSGVRPYTNSNSAKNYIANYDIPIGFEFSAFFFKDYFYRGVGSNAFDMNCSNRMNTWTRSISNYNGDIAVGSVEEPAPKHNQCDYRAHAIAQNVNYAFTREEIINFDNPVSSLRIAWSQSGATKEGIFPFYSGYIYIR